MSRSDFLFTSESVSEGHPDKICDYISDSLLDFMLSIDKNSRVACETFATTDKVIVGGEIGVSSRKDFSTFMNEVDNIIRECVRLIGYDQKGFSWKSLKVENLIHGQSSNIAQGVDNNGAGDQGIMFGYAVDETPEYMPAPIHYAHNILEKLSIIRKNGIEPVLGPDSKSQLTIKYKDNIPNSVSSVVLSTQHLDENLTSEDVKKIVKPYIEETLPENWLNEETIWHVNPTGKFVIGGPDGDTGLTGRKIIVDTYGGAAPHGGGAFSGKDPTKVDRSAAYAARYLAKNIVASGLAKKCLIQLSYAIGVSEPLSIFVNTFGTSKLSDQEIEKKLFNIMDLSPTGIINHLKLKKPIYKKTSAYGHFGRKPTFEGCFSWEKLDLIEELSK